MWKGCWYISAVVVLLALPPGAPAQSAMENRGVEKGVAILYPTEGSDVAGVVTFEREGDGVRVVAELQGLREGEHGFHVHELGDCTSPNADSAGAHFNPMRKSHGGPDFAERHAGDLGNITADAQGMARLNAVDRQLSLNGSRSIIGRAVIVHENADDFVSQPAGNAGGRLACGVVGIAGK